MHSTAKHMISRRQKERGFTLVEMGVVLVIVGLIIGGILFGRDLIRVSELRSVMKNVEDFKKAIYTFEDIYQSLPGDMYNASTDFWAATDDGNGNGRIEGDVSSAEVEGLNAWEQLRLAELLPGAYDGDDTSTDADPGVNVPVSEIGGGYSIDYLAGKHYFILGAYNAGNNTTGNLLTPIDAWQIDDKADDGDPNTGDILDGNSGCEDTNEYDVNADPQTVSCYLQFAF